MIFWLIVAAIVMILFALFGPDGELKTKLAEHLGAICAGLFVLLLPTIVILTVMVIAMWDKIGP